MTGRGRHTSTCAYLLALPDGAAASSTPPGIRSFGLAHVQPENLIEAFPDLDEMTEDCPRGCTHGSDEPECGLDEAVEAGEADPDRVESFRRLLAARSATAGDRAGSGQPQTALAPESPARKAVTRSATAPTAISTATGMPKRVSRAPYPDASAEPAQRPCRERRRRTV